jgi:transcriptional regulator with XRE-family HTH domain
MTSDASHFGLRLQELRMSAGLTQKELAEKAGMALGGLNKLEQAINKPSWETVLALAGALGVSCEDFTSPPTGGQPPGRGRPPKAVDVNPAPKRPRGRPQKNGGGSKSKTKGK